MAHVQTFSFQYGLIADHGLALGVPVRVMVAMQPEFPSHDQCIIWSIEL